WVSRCGGRAHTDPQTHGIRRGCCAPLLQFSAWESLACDTVFLKERAQLTSMEPDSEIERVDRLYAALGRVNRAIVRMPEREELLREACRILVMQGGFRA